MGMMQEFRDFAIKGNVIDLAVGVIIGAAFGKIVSSFVADVIMPVIGILVGGVNFSSLAITLKDAAGATPPVVLAYGRFLQNMLDFTIIAFVIFIAIKAINSMKKKEQAQAAAPATPSKEEILLAEIRDLLKNSTR